MTAKEWKDKYIELCETINTLDLICPNPEIASCGMCEVTCECIKVAKLQIEIQN